MKPQTDNLPSLAQTPISSRDLAKTEGMEPDNRDGLNTSTGGPRLKKLKEQTLIRIQNSSIIDDDLKREDMRMGTR